MGIGSRKAWVTGPLIVLGLFVIMGLSCGCAGASSDPGWSTQTVDSEENVGKWTSITLDSNGNPHISYCDGTNYDLKYAHWTGSSWSIQTVDNEGNVGRFTSITLDSSSYPHISYRDDTNKDLKYAHWTGSSWEVETVDNVGYVGEFTSIALDSSGYPHISYYDRINGDLKYAHWTGSSWSIQTVDNEGDVGEFTSIALDSSGYPHISYHDETNEDLKYARWTGTSWSIQIVDSSDLGLFGGHTSIAIDSSGNPHISYFDDTNDDLKYARGAGSTWNSETVDSAGRVGYNTSIALDSSDNPHISYYDLTNEDLKYARWTGSTWKIETADNVNDVGEYTSIALDNNGYPHISYYDSTDNDLKYAHRTNSTPALSSATVVPSVCPAGWTFTYSSTYTDADNDPPAYIRVYIDNSPHEMVEDDSADDNLLDGKKYKYEWATTTNDIGSHSYHFEASDGFDNVREPADNDNDKTGPTVEKLLTTLTVSPSSFAVKTGSNKSLTATLTSSDAPLQNKLITWSASGGSGSSSTGYTDSEGKVVITYTAPDNEATVTVTASFAEDNTYLASSDGSAGTVAQFVAVLTFSTPDGAPCPSQKIYYRFADDETDNYFGTTDGQGQITITDSNFAEKQVHFSSEDGKYGGTAHISSAGGEVSVVLSAGFEISAGTIVALAAVIVVVALVVMYVRGRKWLKKAEEKPPEVPAIK